ncbi:hypothetical protein ACFX2I_008219 [Malus domestica]
MTQAGVHQLLDILSLLEFGAGGDGTQGGEGDPADKNIKESRGKAPRVGKKLHEKLRGINVSGDQLRLDGLSPLPPDREPTAKLLFRISVRNAKKILRLSQVECLWPVRLLRNFPRFDHPTIEKADGSKPS